MAINLQGPTKHVVRGLPSLGDIVKAPFRVIGGVAYGITHPIKGAGNTVEFFRHPIRNIFQRETADTAGALDEVERLAAKAKGKPLLQPFAEDANRAVNRSIAEKGAEKGYLSGSWNHFRYRMQEALGKDVSKIGSKNLSDNVYQVEQRVAHAPRAGGLERLVSKPLRVAAEYPKTALVAGAVASFMGVRSWINKRDAEQTQLDNLNTMASTQPQGPMMVNAYMNSVNPMESALLEARFRNGGMNGGFGDKVMSDRAAAAAMGGAPQGQ